MSSNDDKALQRIDELILRLEEQLKASAKRDGPGSLSPETMQMHLELADLRRAAKELKSVVSESAFQ